MEEPFTTCPRCGGKLNVTYDYDYLKAKVNRGLLSSRPFNIWRYREVLPVLPQWRIVSLGEGGTHLHKSLKLAERLKVKELYIKDETTNPTGSFLDRGASPLLSRALWLKVDTVTCASTGNLGASLAAYCARAGIKCIVYAPSRTDLGKLYQMVAYGADIKLVEEVEVAEYRAMTRKLGYFASLIDPFLLEGLKTTAWEVCDQLEWWPPDLVFMTMGSGGHLSMCWKALKGMELLGLIDKVKTKMVGIQPIGCAPIVESFKKGRDEVEPVGRSDTGLLDVGFKNPPYGREALRALRESCGRVVAVEDHEALKAMKDLARLEGIFSEPTASATIAGIGKLLEEGAIDKDERIVCIITGEGLKTPKVFTSLAKAELKAGSLVIGIRLRSRLGETKLKILKALLQGSAYGYGLRKKLYVEYGLSLKPSSLYQHLKELEHLGLVREAGLRVVNGRQRRFYDLTERGRRLLEGVELVEDHTRNRR